VHEVFVGPTLSPVATHQKVAVETKPESQATAAS
jgi:hypothetical protein